MLLTNHTLTGVFLGLTIDEPALLFPIAVASHLAQDVVPHVGPPVTTAGWFRDPFFIVVGSLDFAASVAVTAAACWGRPDRAGHIIIGVIGADLPDLSYVPIVVFGRGRYAKFPWYEKMVQFLSDIQHYEKPPGLITEILWAALMLWALGWLPR
jgi:hypothetical protein